MTAVENEHFRRDYDYVSSFRLSQSAIGYLSSMAHKMLLYLPSFIVMYFSNDEKNDDRPSNAAMQFSNEVT